MGEHSTKPTTPRRTMNAKKNHVTLSSSLLLALSLAACGGGGSGGGAQPKSTPGPVVSGLAQYLDVDNDGQASAGDLIAVPFDRPVDVSTATIADFQMRVEGDSFGTGASVEASP